MFNWRKNSHKHIILWCFKCWLLIFRQTQMFFLCIWNWQVFENLFLLCCFPYVCFLQRVGTQQQHRNHTIPKQPLPGPQWAQSGRGISKGQPSPIQKSGHSTFGRRWSIEKFQEWWNGLHPLDPLLRFSIEKRNQPNSVGVFWKKKNRKLLWNGWRLGGICLG